MGLYSNTTQSILLYVAVSVFGYEVGLWYFLAVVTFPVSLLKQAVSLIQLVVACQNIGALDVATRRKQKS